MRYWRMRLVSPTVPRGAEEGALHRTRLAKGLFGAQREQTEQWGKARRDELEHGQMQAILRAIDPHLEDFQGSVHVSRIPAGQSASTRLPRFGRMGLYPSGGVVEAGCKLAVGK